VAAATSTAVSTAATVVVAAATSTAVSTAATVVVAAAVWSSAGAITAASGTGREDGASGAGNGTRTASARAGC